MTIGRRNRSFRRPLLVVVALAAAALAALPQAAGPATTPITDLPLRAAPAGSDPLADAAGALSSGDLLTGGPGVGAPPAGGSLLFATGGPDALAGPGALLKITTTTTTAKPGTAAATAIAFALAQLGLPYMWGGNGPESGDLGFDCSGLTTAAYEAAGVRLPRTAHTQYYAGPHVPAAAALEPGDLVFYGVPERVHHVGLYLGEGRMVSAPSFGKPVRLAHVRYAGDDYLGATRPAAGRDAPGLIKSPDLPFRVPAVPAPGTPRAPTEFSAPPVEPATATPSPSSAVSTLASGPAGSTAADAPAGSATTTTAPPPTEPPATTSTDAPTTTSAPAGRAGVTLADGRHLDLVGVELGEDGLPAAPAEPGLGAVAWRTGEDGAWTAAVRLHPDDGADGMAEGATIVLTGRDGTRHELTVLSRSTVDAATAAATASSGGDGPRLLLVRSDPDTGEVLVVVAG